MIRPSTHAGYKSPVHKLIRFFEDSRDNWKAKYQSLKKDHKRLENRVRFLERSKAEAKKEAQLLRTQFKQQFKQQACGKKKSG